MSSRDLFVVLIRVLGLYVLSGNALYHWATILAARMVDSTPADRDTFTMQLVFALSHTVVGLYFLICAEQIARFAEVSPRPSARDESDESRRPGDEPTT
ncbi:MAG: hypothetical protein AABP62_13080 [Planctomycetota bacterium]